MWENHGQNTSSGLAAGIHEFPFEFQIPNNLSLPSSFEIKCDNHIQYSVFAGISQSGGSFDFSYKSISKIIEFTETVHINTPNLTSPHSVTSQKVVRSFFRTPRSIFLSVRLQRKGYSLGESILINATAENHSKKRIVSLKASLTQKVVTAGIARYRPALLSARLTVRGKKIRVMRFNQNNYQATTAVGQFTYWNDVSVHIPSNSLPPTTLSCQAIQISYTLNVTLVLHNEQNISVSEPITIGNVPFGGQAALPQHHNAAYSDTPVIVSQESYYDCPRQRSQSSSGGGGIRYFGGLGGPGGGSCGGGGGCGGH